MAKMAKMAKIAISLLPKRRRKAHLFEEWEE